MAFIGSKKVMSFWVENHKKDDTKKEKREKKFLSLNLFKKIIIWQNNLRPIFLALCEGMYILYM